MSPDGTEQRLADALRARAAGGAFVPAGGAFFRAGGAFFRAGGAFFRAGGAYVPRPPASPAGALRPPGMRRQVLAALLVALLGGVLLGIGLGLTSVLAPGLLPPFG